MDDEKDREISRLKEQLGYALGFEKEIFSILGVQWFEGCKCHSAAQGILRDRESARREYRDTLARMIDRIQSGERPADLVEDLKQMAVDAIAVYP